MTEFVKIPMFPLSIFPLPGEMVPLHIFEPRYRQLLLEAENKDISFGIFFNHVLNTERMGSLVKLESVIKHYPTGESDVLVKCSDLFIMHKLFRTYNDKLFPGGEVTFCNIDTSLPVNKKLHQAFREYLLYFQIRTSNAIPSYYTIANEINLDFQARLRFVKYSEDQKEAFLISQLKYQSHLLFQAEKAKDVFHLN